MACGSSDHVRGGFLDHWHRSVQIPSRGDNLNVPLVQSKLQSYLRMVSTLRELHCQLLITSEESEKARDMWERVSQLKKEILEIEALLHPQLRQNLCFKMAHTRANHGRVSSLKRKQILQYRRSSDESGALCDQWLKQRRTAELKAKLERSVESSAGGTMLAVKKKLSDINKCADLLLALKKLREFRKGSNRAKGEVSLVHDELFEKRCSTLDELITSRKKLYEAEEHALRVMMTEQASSELRLKNMGSS